MIPDYAALRVIFHQLVRT